MNHALTVNDLSNVNAIGDRLNGVVDLLKRLRDLNLDMSGLMRLVALFGEIRTAPTTREKVVAALEALKLLAQITPTETDDKIVAAITSVLSGVTLDLLCNLVDAWLGNRSLALDVIEADVVAAGIDRSVWFELFKLVIGMIRSQRGK